MGAKKIDRSSHIGDGGIAVIHSRVSEMGLAWHARQVDVGIDGMIEIRDPLTGEVANRFLLVQSKASERPFPGENDKGFHFLCDERDVDYWMSSQVPVLLVCSHPSIGRAWWAHVQGWFSDPARRAAGRIDFDKATQEFDKRAAGRLLALADPNGVAHTPVMAERRETLTSNLLPVDVPDAMFSVPVRVAEPGELARALRAKGAPRVGWVLRNKRMYTFHDPATLGVDALVTGATEAEHPTRYALDDEERRNIVVQLLNDTLRIDLAPELGWDRDSRVLYFRADKPLRTTTRLGPHGRKREVVAVHRNQKAGYVNYCKHMAMRWRFHLIGDEWFMDVTPEYRYTIDGFKVSGRAPALTAGIKKLEKHAAVRGQLEFWAHFLRPNDANLLASPRRLVTFHPLVTFDVEFGIDDDEWAEDRKMTRPHDVSAVDGTLLLEGT